MIITNQNKPKTTIKIGVVTSSGVFAGGLKIAEDTSTIDKQVFVITQGGGTRIAMKAGTV